jgi:hypothetical protein
MYQIFAVQRHPDIQRTSFCVLKMRLDKPWAEPKVAWREGD